MRTATDKIAAKVFRVSNYNGVATLRQSNIPVSYDKQLQRPADLSYLQFGYAVP